MSAIRDMFGGIAGIYDRMNRALSLGLDRRWRRAAASAAGEAGADPARVLDLACGTGDMARAVAARFPRAAVTGADFTPAMLEIARRKCAGAGFAFVEADAQALPFGAGAFDLVTCAFGFRNFPDKPRALAECARVLRPGGTLVVLEFFRPESRLLGGLASLWLRVLAPALAPRNAAAYAYLRESVRATLPAGAFAELARAQGFARRAARFLFPACTCLVFARGAEGPADGAHGRNG